MSERKTFKEMAAVARCRPEYYTEGMMVEFTQAILEHMEAKGITKTELAKRLNCSKPYVSGVLKAETNLTIESITKIAFALGLQVCLRFSPINRE